MSFGARVRIHLRALEQNFTLLKNAAGTSKICAVVKANAFGHGLLTISRNLPGVDCLAVARLGEARALRSGGIGKPILLLSGVMTHDGLAEAIELDCEIVVHDVRQLELLESYGSANVTAWLKVDTGMHRLGVAATVAPEYLRRLGAASSVGKVGLMTHLANADNVDHPMTPEQVDRFMGIVDGFEGDISVANSAAMLGWRELLNEAVHSRANTWVRPGIALYGISPFPGRCGADLGLRPVMELESRLIAVKPVSRGEPVGYGGTWAPAENTNIGIVSAGYGDGYPRFIPSGTPILVAGRRVSLAGTVSMDMLAVDLGPDAHEQVGDSVILWGDLLPAEEIAACAGTIAYQLVCGVTHRETSEITPVDRGKSD